MTMSAGLEVDLSGLSEDTAMERSRVMVWISRTHNAIVDDIDRHVAREGPLPPAPAGVSLAEKYAMMAVLDTLAKEIAAGDHGRIKIIPVTTGGRA